MLNRNAKVKLYLYVAPQTSSICQYPIKVMRLRLSNYLKERISSTKKSSRNWNNISIPLSTIRYIGFFIPHVYFNIGHIISRKNISTLAAQNTDHNNSKNRVCLKYYIRYERSKYIHLIAILANVSNYNLTYNIWLSLI